MPGRIDVGVAEGGQEVRDKVEEGSLSILSTVRSCQVVILWNKRSDPPSSGHTVLVSYVNAQSLRKLIEHIENSVKNDACD